MKKFLVLALVFAVFMAIPVSAAKNLTSDASCTASSSYSEAYDASFAIDGNIMTPDARYPYWLTDYETDADVTITWASAQNISKVVLYDIPDNNSNVISGSLKFSDGTTVKFNELDPAGAGTEVAVFDTPVVATSVTITVNGDDETLSVGLAEAEFYDAAGNNVALNASGATATSVGINGDPDVWNPEYFTDEWYSPTNLYDGYFNVMSYEYCEWSSASESNPTYTLTWTSAVTVGTIVLYDRYNTADDAIAGTITFDDGTTVQFSGLDPAGRALYVDIPNITTKSITITVTESKGSNIGFGEIEVYTEKYVNGAFVEEAASTTVGETQGAAEAATEAVAEAAEVPVVAPNTGDTTIILSVATLLCAAAFIMAKKSHRA